jgi:hypothetical protein
METDEQRHDEPYRNILFNQGEINIRNSFTYEAPCFETDDDPSGNQSICCQTSTQTEEWESGQNQVNSFTKTTKWIPDYPEEVCSSKFAFEERGEQMIPPPTKMVRGVTDQVEEGTWGSPSDSLLQTIGQRPNTFARCAGWRPEFMEPIPKHFRPSAFEGYNENFEVEEPVKRMRPRAAECIVTFSSEEMFCYLTTFSPSLVRVIMSAEEAEHVQSSPIFNVD